MFGRRTGCAVAPAAFCTPTALQSAAAPHSPPPPPGFSFTPGVLVRVLVHTHPHGVPSKLNAKYSGLCEVIEVRGPTLTLRELDSQRVFTASHDAVRASTLPPREPQNPAPLVHSQPYDSQAAEQIGDSQSLARLEDQQADQFGALDGIFGESGPRAETGEHEYEIANTSREPSEIPSLLDLEVPIPEVFRNVQSHSTPTSRPRRNARVPIRYESSQSFADTVHETEYSQLRAHASTPKSSEPQLATRRRDSQSHLEPIRKKSRAAVQITSAASRDHAISVASKRGAWAPQAVNCCALSTRVVTPPVCKRAPAAHSESHDVTQDKQVARGDHDLTVEPCVFTFETSAIKAFAHECESRAAVRHDYAISRVHAGPVSIGHALYADSEIARAARDPCDSRRHKTECKLREPNYSFRLNIDSSALRNRRLSRVYSRTSTSSPPTSSLFSVSDFISSIPHVSIPRSPPKLHSSTITTGSANTKPPPMDQHDAAAIFSNAAFGFADFRVACEMLRDCAEVDLVIRGLDAQFGRDIATTGSNSIRDFLRSHFAKLPEIVRALYEYAIIECREATPAVSISVTGQREETSVCSLHIRSCYAALVVVELIRREFAARRDLERLQLLIVAHTSKAPSESAPQTLDVTHARELEHTSSAGHSLSAPTPAHPNRESLGARELDQSANFTPPDSGAASSSTPRPPIAPPRVFGTDFSALPLSFATEKSIAEASAAAAALAASNAAMREEEIAQGVYSPRPFPSTVPRSFAAAASSTLPPPSIAPSAAHVPAQPLSPPSTAPSAAHAPPPPPVPPSTTLSTAPVRPPPPSSSAPSIAAAPQPSAIPSTAASSGIAAPAYGASQPAVSTEFEAGPESKGRRSKRRASPPMRSDGAKRSAASGTSAEDPVLVESPEKPAETHARLSSFAFDEERSRDTPPPALVIAESESSTGPTASKAAEPASRAATPQLPIVEDPELESPRSPSPMPPAESSVSRRVETATSPRPVTPASSTPMAYPEYTADEEAAHATWTFTAVRASRRSFGVLTRTAVLSHALRVERERAVCRHLVSSGASRRTPETRAAVTRSEKRRSRGRRRDQHVYVREFGPPNRTRASRCRSELRENAVRSTHRDSGPDAFEFARVRSDNARR